jgi:hypothetical protein
VSDGSGIGEDAEFAGRTASRILNLHVYNGVQLKLLSVRRAMRCVACGAEMILTNVVRDDAMALLGFEHHTFRCSKCHDVDRRLVFIKHGRQDDAEPVPLHAAPPIALASPVQDDQIATLGVFRRMLLAKLRSHEADVQR